MDEDMPRVLLKLCAHVMGYEVVCARWEQKDFRENVPSAKFPVELDQYIRQCFKALKQEQINLLGSHHHPAPS
jgi:hypothetical protein